RNPIPTTPALPASPGPWPALSPIKPSPAPASPSICGRPPSRAPPSPPVPSSPTPPPPHPPPPPPPPRPLPPPPPPPPHTPMPPACRALPPAASPNGPPTQPAVELLTSFVRSSVDALVRIAVAEAPSGRRTTPTFASLHDQWAYALRSPDGALAGQEKDLEQ